MSEIPNGSSFWNVIHVANTGNRVAHSCSLVNRFAFHEKLEVAVDSLVKIEAVRQCILRVFLNVDSLDLVDLGGISQHEVIDMFVDIDELCRILYAVLWDRHGALDYGIFCVLPLGFVVAHEEGAVWVEMNTADIKAQLFLGFEEDAELIQYFLEAWF